MTQEQLRVDLNTVENKLDSKLSVFMIVVYNELRMGILKDLLELQIKEFNTYCCFCKKEHSRGNSCMGHFP